MKQIKILWFAIAALTVMTAASMTAQAESKIKPFILGSTDAGDIATKAAAVKSSLEGAGFEIAGEYSPYEGAHIIVVTNSALRKAGASHSRGGYISAQRVTITKVGDQVQTSYTNPQYMAAAYHVKTDLSSVSSALEGALGAVKQYGLEDGMSLDDLEGYHYTFGMEYFDEPYELSSHDSYKDALAAVEKGLAARTGGTTKVYRIDIPGTNQTLFGVGMAAGDDGNKYMDEKFIMNEIDFHDVRSTGHLPYEVLVNGGEVEALHARFRIAMNFPDLSMMGSHSFMNIMPTPDAIKEALTKATGGEVVDDF